MMETERELTSKQEAFLIAKLSNPGMSVKRIGEMIGVSESTAERYNLDPTVKAKIEAQYEESKAVLRQATLLASQRLIELLDSRKEGIRLHAIKMILGGILPQPEKGAETPPSLPLSDKPLEGEDWLRIIKQARGLDS